jgi:hypothetical protein
MMYVDNIAYVNSLDRNVIREPYIPGYMIAGLVIVSMIAIGEFIYISNQLTALKGDRQLAHLKNGLINQERPY